MPLDPNTDIDEGSDQVPADDVAQQDYQDQLERQQVGIGSPSFRSTAPGVYSPTPAPAPTPAPQPQGIAPPVSRRPPPSGGDYEVVRSSSFTPQAAPDSGKSLTWKDYGDQVWRGVLGTTSSVAGAVDFVQHQIDNDPDLKTYAGNVRDWATQHAQETLDGMSPRAQQVLSASLLGYVPGSLSRDAQGNQIPTPGSVGWSAYLAMHLTEMIPDGLAMLVPGAILGKAAVKTAELFGVTTKAVKAGETAGETVETLTKAGETAASVGHAAGTGAYFGTEGAGQFYNQIHQEIGDASDADLKAGSAYYAQLRNLGMSEGQAKHELTQRAAPFVYGAGVAGAVGGGVMGLGKGIVRGALTGAAAMGAQGGATSALQQTAEQQAGTRQGYDLGSILADTVSAGAQGAVLGAAGGAFHRGGAAAREAPPEPPPRSGVDTDESAALRDQLQIPGPPEQKLLTYEGGQQQALPSPTGTSINVPAGPGQVVQPPGPVRFGDVNIAPVTRGPEPPPTVPPPAAAPPAAQAAIDASRRQSVPPTEPPAGGAPGPPGAPAGPRPSEGMSRQQLSDALTGQVDPKALKSMSAKDMATRYDRLAPAPETTTVVEGSGPAPPTSEPETAPTQAGGAAPPSPLAGVGSLPVATEAAGTKVPETPTPKASGTPVVEQPRRTTVTPEQLAAPPPEKPATAAAIAASRRKAAKGQMAQPGPPVRGDVAEAQMIRPGQLEGPESETPAVEQARADRVGDLAEAFRAIPAPKGSALEAVLRKAQRYLSEAVGSTDGTKDGLAELIHNWMEKEPTAPYPGTKVTAKALGEHLMEHAAGQRPVEREGARAEIAEVRREEASRTGAESKTITGESIEQAAAKGDEGAEGTSAITPVVKKAEELPDTTDHRRTADNLIQKVLNHEMTPAEADARYGKPQSGAGAKRRWPRLADRLKDWIADAEDPKVERGVLEQLAETQNNEKLTPHQKSTQTKKLTAMLERTGPEFASELREHLRGMEDPVGQAADQARQAERAAARADVEQRTTEREGRPYHLQGTPTADGIDPRSSRSVRVSYDPRLNEFVHKGLRASEQYGERYTLHDALRAIVQHSGVRDEMRPMWQLARTLLGRTQDVEIHTPQSLYLRGDLTEPEYRSLSDPGVSGGYSAPYYGDPARILLNPRAEDTGTVQTVLHEAVHRVLDAHISNLLRADPNHPHLQALRAIASEFDRILPELSHNDPTREMIGLMRDNPHEVHTYLMTNPEMAALAASRQASPELLRTLRRLGFYGEPKQSVWRTFVNVTRRALGMNAPASASEYTLLDHVMRPLTDIMDRAVEHNEKLLPQDPELRTRAEPLYRGVSQVARDVYDRTKSTVEREAPYAGSALMDRTRPMTAAITNMDQMVLRYGDVFEPSDRLVMPAGNPLVRVRDAGEAIAYRAKQFLDKFVDRENSLTARAKSLDPKQQDAFAQLMNDATIANAHLGPGADNSHLTTDAQKATLTALQRRFAALKPDTQKVEQDFVKIHGDMDKVEREAKIEGILSTVFPDATEAQREQFRNITASKDRLEKFLANPDTSALARSYGDAWDSKYGDLVKVSAQAINDGWQRGDFVPLRRTGDYAVAYGERGTPSEGLEMFDTRGQAEERYAELARDPELKETLRNVDFTRENALSNEMRGNPLIEQLTSALRKRPDLADKADEIHDLMNKLVLEATARSDGSRMRRPGIKGASLDFSRVLAKEMQDTAVRTGYLAHGGERFTAVNDMRRIADDLAAHGEPGQSRMARQVINEVEKRVTAQENVGGVGAAIARRAGMVGYLQSLASWSHIATATIENYSMAIPQIAARHGIGRTTLEMGRVGKSLIAPMVKSGATNMMKALGNRLKEKDWNLSDVMAAHLIDSGFNASHVNAVFNMLRRTGLVDHSYARELRRLANPAGITSAIGRGVDYFNNLMASWSHAVDAANRSNVAMSAFNLELRRTGDMAKALAYSEERAREASPNYNLANKNRFSTSAGPLGTYAAPLTQFKQYGFFAYGVLGNAVKQAMSGATAEARSEARYALAGMLASHALTAGALTMPFIAEPLRYAGGLYDYWTGAKKPHDYQADIRGFLARQIGPEMGELVSRGAIDTFLGTSVHRRVGFANVLEIPELESFDMTGMLKAVGTALSGASGEDALKFATGLQAMGQGDIEGGLRAMVPRPIRDMTTAYNLATEGVKTQAGRTILPPSQITPYDVAVQALGFQPSRVSEAREGSAAIQQARDEAQAEHTRLTNRWLQASPSDRQDVMQEIRLYNQDPRNIGSRITVQQLLKDQEQRRKQAATPGAFGLRLPRRGATQLEQAGAFANVQ